MLPCLERHHGMQDAIVVAPTIQVVINKLLYGRFS